MHRLLNILAVMVGMLSLVTVLSGVALFVMAVALYVKGSEPAEGLTNLTMVGFGAGLGFLGGLFGSRALGHLRRPDARSASDVLTMGIYIVALAGVLPLLKIVPYAVFPLLIGLYFVRRHVRKQTARTFLPEGTPSAAVALPARTTAGP